MSHSTQASQADLRHRFGFHPASTEEKALAHGSVRSRALQLALQLDEALPPGREKSLAMTGLEEVMFWANAAIARDVPKGGPTGTGASNAAGASGR